MVSRYDWDWLFNKTFADLNELVLDKNKYSGLELQNLIPELFTQPLKYGERDQLYYKLLLLQQRKSGRVAEEVKNVSQDNLSTEQLLSSVMASLSRIISIEVSAEASVHLVDFSLDSMPQLTLIFQFLLPVKFKELEVKINTLMMEWFEALTNFLYTNENYNQGDLLVYSAINTLRLTDFYNWYALLAKSTVWNAKEVCIIDAPEMVTTSNIPQQTVKLEVPIDTKWHLLTNNKCNNGNQTHSACVQWCTMQKHSSKCGCIPWQMSHYGPSEKKLCTQPCSLTDHISCEDDCVRVCSRYAVAFDYVRTTRETHDNLIEFRLFIREAMHLKLVESRSFTTGTFVAELGALLDMWLGMNLFAILHSLVYFCKWCLTRKNASTMTETKIESMESVDQLLASLKYLRKCISKTVQRLRKCVKNPSRNEQKLQNEFFSQTPLTGFQYIATTKYKWEAGLWYFIIAIFCVLTVTSVHNAFLYYQAKHMSVNVALLDPSFNDTFPNGNLTLNFALPILELAETNPTSLGYVKMFKYSEDKSVAQFLASSLLYVPEKGLTLLHNIQYEALWDKWSQLDHWKAEKRAEKILSQDLSSETNFKHWLQIFDAGASKMRSFLAAYNGTSMPTEPAAAEKIQKEFAELLDAPMRRCRNAYIRFWQLDAVRSGEDPQDKMLRAIGRKNETRISMNYEANGLELYNQIVHDLGFMFHVRVRGAPGTRVSVRDLNYKRRSTQLRNVETNALESLDLKLHVDVPKETKTNKLEFEVRSYTQMWHHHIWDVFYNHFSEYAYSDLHKTEDYVRYAKQQYAERWMDKSLTDYHLTLQMASGSEQIVYLFSQYYLSFYFARYFASHSKDCFAGSLDSCLAECQTEVYMSTCSCIPSTLLYYHANVESVCSQPCHLSASSLVACKMECQRKQLHVCQTALYEIQHFQPTEMNNYDLPIYTFSLLKEQKNHQHLKYTEIYDLTLGSFISQIGGLCDLWLGLNLLAFIHLLVYGFKRCTHRLTNATTGPDLELANISRTEAKMNKRVNNLINQIQQKNKFSGV